MTTRGQRFALARVTVTFTAPVGVGKGEDSRDDDCPFVVDAGGKPSLPGTSIAGLLRSAVGPARAEQWFGFQRRSRGQVSRVEVSWAHPHAADDRPAGFAEVAEGDAVLSALAEGIKRDHVNLGPRGVVTHRGKFDENLVPAGARFTFELRVHEASGDTETADVILDHLLALLRGPGTRLGGRTRRGHGRFEVTRVLRGRFDLSGADDLARWCRVPVDLAAPLPADVLREDRGREKRSPERLLTLEATISPVDFWYFGGGKPSAPEHRRDGKSVAGVPYTERRVAWTAHPGGQRGEVSPAEGADVVFVASGVKGALRHRTAFHFRALKAQKVMAAGGDGKTWLADPTLPPEDRIPAEVEALFGAIKEKGDGGQPGRVLVDEFTVASPRYGRLDHVSIDRFTQGPVDGALFDEAPVAGGAPMALEIHLDRRGATIDPEARAAFRASILDLLGERLALGAAQNRGHGFFSGKLSDRSSTALDNWVREGK